MIYILNICYIYTYYNIYSFDMIYIYVIKDSLIFIKSIWEKHDHQ